MQTRKTPNTNIFYAVRYHKTPNKGLPKYGPTVVLMQNISRFWAHPDVGSRANNQDLLLKDQWVEEKQYFKRLSVYISMKYRKLQRIKKIV